MSNIKLEYDWCLVEDEEENPETIYNAIGIVIKKCKFPGMSEEANFMLFYTKNIPQGDELCQPLNCWWNIHINGALVLGLKTKREVFGDFVVDDIIEKVIRRVKRIEIRQNPENWEYFIGVVTERDRIALDPNDVAYIKMGTRKSKALPARRLVLTEDAVDALRD